MADDIVASCGDVKFEDATAEYATLPLFGEERQEFDRAEIGNEAEFFDEFFDAYRWYIAERSGRALLLFGTLREETASGPQFASASFKRRRERWLPTGWGQCRIERSARGWGNARFSLDPDEEPDPASTKLSVLTNEMTCAGGKAPDGRQVHPLVFAADDEVVSVLILVEPPRGDQTCPGGPRFPVQVDLGQPLGDRSVLDASVIPPLERPWPPTESSLETGGLDA